MCDCQASEGALEIGLIVFSRKFGSLIMRGKCFAVFLGSLYSAQKVHRPLLFAGSCNMPARSFPLPSRNPSCYKKQKLWLGLAFVVFLRSICCLPLRRLWIAVWFSLLQRVFFIVVVFSLFLVIFWGVFFGSRDLFF